MGQGSDGRGGGHVDRAVAGLCGAAHVEDGRGCDGPVDAVRVVDAVGDEATGCVRHGSALLASLDGGRVYPGSVDGAAIEVYRAARELEPFGFMRRQPEQEQVVWPPAELEDTSDELHEQPWWVAELPPAVQVEGVAPGRADGRLCGDLRDAGDDAVLREALCDAVEVGLISPAEAVELWPAGDPFPPVVELAGDVVGQLGGPDAASAASAVDDVDGW